MNKSTNIRDYALQQLQEIIHRQGGVCVRDTTDDVHIAVRITKGVVVVNRLTNVASLLLRGHSTGSHYAALCVHVDAQSRPWVYVAQSDLRTTPYPYTTLHITEWNRVMLREGMRIMRFNYKDPTDDREEQAHKNLMDIQNIIDKQGGVWLHLCYPTKFVEHWLIPHVVLTLDNYTVLMPYLAPHNEGIATRLISVSTDAGQAHVVIQSDEWADPFGIGHQNQPLLRLHRTVYSRDGDSNTWAMFPHNHQGLFTHATTDQA